MRPGLAIFHPKATVESHGVFMSNTKAASRGLAQTIRDRYSPDNPRFNVT
jgi:hypothetical protein